MALYSCKLRAVGLLSGLALAGCAGSSDRYPSLSVREFERAPVSNVEGNSLAPRPLGADVLARIDNLLSEAQNAHQAFVEATPSATRIVSAAAGTTVEENAWSAAQIALAELDAKRGRTAISLGDIDLLYAGATLDFSERNGIAEARDKIVMLIAMEDTTLERLRSQLDR